MNKIFFDDEKGSCKVKDYIRTLAALADLVFYIAPIYSIIKLIHLKAQKRISKRKTNRSSIVLAFLNATLYSAMLLGVIVRDSSQRNFYTIFSMAVHMIGIIISAVYSALYISKISDESKKTKKIIGSIILQIGTLALVFSIFVVLIAGVKVKDFDIYASYALQVVTFIMYITPGTNICKLFREKDREYINFVSSIIGLTASVCWLCVGVFEQACSVNLKTLDMIIARAFDIIINIIQIVFYKKLEPIDEMTLVGEEIEQGDVSKIMSGRPSDLNFRPSNLSRISNFEGRTSKLNTSTVSTRKTKFSNIPNLPSKQLY